MKIKVTFIMICSLLFAQSGFPATRNKLTNEPAGMINFESSSVDFGTIKRGQKVTAKFKFRNAGSGPLSIQGIQAPCDCTTVDTTKGKVIASGEVGVVEVIFDSTDYAGQITKAVTVVTNERTLPDRTLTISANVLSEIEAIPPLVDFGEIIVSQTNQQKIVLKNLMKNELKIEKLRYNEDLLDVGYAKEGKDWVLHVKLKPSAPIGFIKETIFVKNNSLSLPDMPIPVRISVKGQIYSNPSYIEFGSISKGAKATRQIALSSTSTFDISSHKFDLLVNGNKMEGVDSQLKISVIPSENNGKKISLDLINLGQNQGSVHGKIYLETTNPQQKTIIVDFYAFFR